MSPRLQSKFYDKRKPAMLPYTQVLLALVFSPKKEQVLRSARFPPMFEPVYMYVNECTPTEIHKW